MINKMEAFITKIKKCFNNLSNNLLFKKVFNIITYVLSGIMLLLLLFLIFSLLTSVIRFYNSMDDIYSSIHIIPEKIIFPNLKYLFIFLLITILFAVNMFLLFIKKKNTCIVINSLLMVFIYLFNFIYAINKIHNSNLVLSDVEIFILIIYIFVLMISLIIYSKINKKVENLAFDGKNKISIIINIYTIVVIFIIVFLSSYYLVETMIENKNIIYDKFADDISKKEFKLFLKQYIIPITLFISTCSCLIIKLIKNIINKKNSTFLVPFTFIYSLVILCYVLNYYRFNYFEDSYLYYDEVISIGYSNNLLVIKLISLIICVCYFVLYLLWYIKNRKIYKEYNSEVNIYEEK